MQVDAANGFTGTIHHMDAKVGGTYQMSFTNFSSGNQHSFGGTFVELVPNERIRYTDRFDDPNEPYRGRIWSWNRRSRAILSCSFAFIKNKGHFGGPFYFEV